MIFVTGGTGILGSHLLLSLVKQGKNVRALKRPNSDLSSIQVLFNHANCLNEFSQIEWVNGDVLDIQTLNDSIKGVDEVYHCAGFVSFRSQDADKILKINIEGSANIVNAMLEQKVKKLCYVSSTAAIGKPVGKEIISEKTKWKQTKHTSLYALGKHFGEREAWRGAEEGLDVVIVNPSIIVGPGNWGQSSTSFFPQVWKGLNYYSSGSNGFVDVRDVVQCMLTLMERGIKNEKFLIVGENKAYRDFFDLIAERLQKPKATTKAGKFLSEFAWRAESIRSYFTNNPPLITKQTSQSANQTCSYSNEKIRKAIGFEFSSITNAINYTAELFLRSVT